MKPQEFSELKPKVVLGVAAHPDDLDFGSAGTLAKFAADGADVYYLLLTDGSKGTDDLEISPEELVKTRREEQRAACKAIGGKDCFFLDYPDGCLKVNLELKREIVKVIRKLKPDVVIAFDPTMVYSLKTGMVNHTDHRAAGLATIDAVYPLARDHLSFPELYQHGLKPHKVKTLLLVNFDNKNYYVDVSQVMDAKFAAIKAHASQLSDFEGMKKMFTDWAAATGKEAGCRYAEGFVRLDMMP